MHYIKTKKFKSFFCGRIMQFFLGTVRLALSWRVKILETSFWAKPRKTMPLACEPFCFQMQNRAAGSFLWKWKGREARIFSELQQIIWLSVGRNSGSLIVFCPLLFCLLRISCLHLLWGATSQCSDKPECPSVAVNLSLLWESYM